MNASRISGTELESNDLVTTISDTLGAEASRPPPAPGLLMPRPMPHWKEFS